MTGFQNNFGVECRVYEDTRGVQETANGWSKKKHGFEFLMETFLKMCRFIEERRSLLLLKASSCLLKNKTIHYRLKNIWADIALDEKQPRVFHKAIQRFNFDLYLRCSAESLCFSRVLDIFFKIRKSFLIQYNITHIK